MTDSERFAALLDAYRDASAKLEAEKWSRNLSGHSLRELGRGLIANVDATRAEVLKAFETLKSERAYECDRVSWLKDCREEAEAALESERHETARLTARLLDKSHEKLMAEEETARLRAEVERLRSDVSAVLDRHWEDVYPDLDDGALELADLLVAVRDALGGEV